jgi:hypothetical protein
MSPTIHLLSTIVLKEDKHQMYSVYCVLHLTSGTALLKAVYTAIPSMMYLPHIHIALQDCTKTVLIM